MVKTRIIRLRKNNTTLEFDVNPQELIITAKRKLHLMELLGSGAVALPGREQPITARFTAMLPSINSPYYGSRSPSEVMKILENWRVSQKPVMLEIGVSFHLSCYLTLWEQHLREGDSDQYVTVELTGSGEAEVDFSQPAFTTKLITVVKGETLWSIAKRIYGDGAQWKKLSEANGGIREVTPGMRLLAPH